MTYRGRFFRFRNFNDSNYKNEIIVSWRKELEMAFIRNQLKFTELH